MFRINKVYKIEMKRTTDGESLYFTGRIAEEDDNLIKLLTDRDGELIIAKRNIVQSKLITDNEYQNNVNTESRYR